jgi:hypothetical protein
MEMMRMGTTYMYGVYDSAYVCKECGDSMPMNMGGEDASVHFSYCPFCGKKIRAFYETKEDAESILTAFELQEYT